MDYQNSILSQLSGEFARVIEDENHTLHSWYSDGYEVGREIARKEAGYTEDTIFVLTKFPDFASRMLYQIGLETGKGDYKSSDNDGYYI